MAKTKRPIAIVDFDTATYVGDENDGVYFAVAKGPDGWYVSASVDCNSRHWTDTLITDDGPYPTESSARLAGKDCARSWCRDNDVSLVCASCGESPCLDSCGACDYD